jgi:hypothetical protein
MNKKQLCMIILIFLGFCIYLSVASVCCLLLVARTTELQTSLPIFLIYLVVGTISLIGGLVIKKKYHFPMNW